MEQTEVVVVGGGQAGLATSRCLAERGVDHVVLERGRVGETWRHRWDSFCLVTPNWTVQLPSSPYRGSDPDGFMPRDEIVAYLENYASEGAAPIRLGVEVLAVERRNDLFQIKTSDGEFRAPAIVLATGAYQRPHRPAVSAGLSPSIYQIDVDTYRNPHDLPSGPVLVVGSGQSGCQVAEELSEAGRRVVLACGRAPWGPRRIAGKDLLWWATEDGFLDQTVDQLASPDDRLFANVLTTGKGGGHDLHLRTLRRLGVELAGHLVGVEGSRARFRPDLSQTVAWGDERYRKLVEDFYAHAAAHAIDVEPLPEPEPITDDGPEMLDLNGFGAVIFASGFRPDYGPLVPWAGALDASGFPVQTDGASTVIPGLYFVGAHFLRKRKSSLLIGVGEDAEIVAAAIADAFHRKGTAHQQL
ncbi:MAG TPA: NAD(P)-binding domain-containing protein [Acidimicrobiia bacterium]|nr:NAD(P)-binding domain-containing protein [Acidimicrobiia bacterium]